MKRTTKAEAARTARVGVPRGAAGAGQGAAAHDLLVAAGYDEPAAEIVADPAEPAAIADDDALAGPDDSLGLYLRRSARSAAEPRRQELALACRLENARRRFRRAALWNWLVLGRVREF